MSSDRDNLAELLSRLLVAQQQNQDWYVSRSSGDTLCLDGWFDPTALAAAVLDAGLRPPARRIETPEQLATLGFPCGIREIPDDDMEFYPQVWEMGFQVGWCRAGQMFDENDCTPTLPVLVLWEGDGE